MSESPEQPRHFDDQGRVAADLAGLNCGHKLRTRPASGCCPQCGRPVVEPRRSDSARLDAEGRIACDLPCVNCGYNVRTLGASGKCPECGHAVADALRGFHLKYCSPAWVGQLARGMLWIVVALALGMAGFLVGQLANMSYAVRAGIDAAVAAIAAIVVTVGAPVFGIAGLIDVTRRAPAALGREEGLTARRMIRIGLLGALALLAAILLMLAARFMPRPPSLRYVHTALTIALCVLLLGVIPLALLRHLSTLLQRIPRLGLARFARITFWCHVIIRLLVGGAYAVFLLIFLRPTAGPPLILMPVAMFRAQAMAVMAIMGLAACGMIIVGIVSLVLFVMAYRALDAAAREATAHAAGGKVATAIPQL
ncbi:MAG: hypothetical protein JSV72_24845 [Ralstonia sp.]|nr:MAG: hypothetical protein JSV72_24845 [Ralstonia sp.]